MRLPVLGEAGLPEHKVGGAPNSVSDTPVVSIATLDILRGLAMGLPCGLEVAQSIADQADFDVPTLDLSHFDLFVPKA